MSIRKKRPLLCAAIMVKDEAERIARTLGTVIQHVRRVVTLDTGSKDDTVAITKRFCEEHHVPLTLKTGPFIDFSQSRNLLLQHCQGLSEFILLLDANDEARHMKTLVKFLKSVRGARRECVFGCRYVWENDSGIRGNDSTYYKIGVIRNNCKDIYYEFPVHEVITSSNRSKMSHKRYVSNNNLQLTNFYIYQDRLLDKPSTSRFKSDIEMLKQYIQFHGPHARSYRYICQSYTNLKDYDKLLKYALKYKTVVEDKSVVNLDTEFDDNYYHALMYLGKASANLDNADFHVYYLKAYKHCLSYFENAVPLYDIAAYYAIKKKWQLSKLYINRCCAIPPLKRELFYTHINKKVYTYHRWTLYYKIGEQIGDDAMKTKAVDELGGIVPTTKSETSNINEIMKNRKKVSIESLAPHLKDKIKAVLPKTKTLLETRNVKNNAVLILVVAYRDRKDYLRTFLTHMHTYLTYHHICYEIWIAEQMDKTMFNKGMLFNAAAQQLLLKQDEESANKNYYLCLHDVDIIPTKGTNYYQPLDGEVNHLYGYTFSLGGVVLINLNDYMKVNGFSNRYDGWGYEDNDFNQRIVNHNDIIIKRNYFYKRFDKTSFKELDVEDAENKKAELKKKWVLEQTKNNETLFLSFKNSNEKINQNDGIQQILDIDTTSIINRVLLTSNVSHVQCHVNRVREYLNLKQKS